MVESSPDAVGAGVVLPPDVPPEVVPPVVPPVEVLPPLVEPPLVLPPDVVPLPEEDPPDAATTVKVTVKRSSSVV